MKILLIMNLPIFPTYGGANKANRALLEAFAENGHKVQAVVPTFGVPNRFTHNEILGKLATHGISVKSTEGVDNYHLNGVDVHSVLDAAKLRHHLVAQVEKFQPDWVLVSGEDPSQNLLTAALEVAAEKVIYLCNSPASLTFGPYAFFPSQSRTKLFSKVRAIISCSKYLQDYIKEWGGFDSTLFYYIAYGYGPFPYLAHFDNEFVTIVNPSAIKGLPIFLALAEHLPTVKFAAVPTWGTTSEDRALLEKFPNITILDPVDEIDQLFARTSILLMPSIWQEAYGIVTVEAMLRGIPVLASNIGGLVEAKLGTNFLLPIRQIEGFQDRIDENSIPVPIIPEQDATPWVDALKKLTSDRDLYQKESAAARTAATQFVGSLNVDAFEELLKRLNTPQPVAKTTVTVEEKVKPVSAPEPKAVKPELALAGKLSGKNLTAEQEDLLMLWLAKKAAKQAKTAPKRPQIERVPRDRDLPLSFAQQRLWFVDQFEGASNVFNESVAVRLVGELNIPALEKVITEIIWRHEALRTNFIIKDGQPVQIIAGEFRFALPFIDLSSKTEQERETEAFRLASIEANAVFNLSKDILLRALLLKMKEGEHVALLTLHHIASDGWSMGVLVKEVAALYEAFYQDKPSPLPPLPIQYADFAVWQQRWLSGEVLEKQLSYWKNSLSGNLPVLEMPTDRPRPAIKTYNGAMETRVLSKDLTKAVNAFCQEENTTLFMVLFSIFNLLLFRYTGQTDFVIGSPISGRNFAEVEGLIGFFVNLLPLRVTFSEDLTYKKLLELVRDITLKAYDHQDLPFDKMVESLNPKRDLSRSPFFQVALSVANTPITALHLPKLNLSLFKLDKTLTKLDLMIVAQEQEQGLVLSIEYNTDLFDQATIARMFSHYENLLGAVLNNREAHLTDLPLLSKTEIEQILVAWNDTAIDYPQEKTIQELFEAQVERSPEGIALVFEDQEVTYRALNERANQLAHYLRKEQVGPESLVAICLDRSIEMIVSILGVLKAGGAYLPLDKDYPQQRLSFMLNDARPALLLTTQTLLEQLSELDTSATRPIILESIAELLSAELTDNLINLSVIDNLAYIIYTSGSTGRPKGVLVPQRGVCSLAKGQLENFSMSPDKKVLQFASYNFDASVLEIFMALLSGARLYLANKLNLMPGPDLVKMLQQAGITTAFLTPSVLSAIPANELTQLQTLTCGGDACTNKIVKEWSVKRNFYNVYGPTETTICCTSVLCEPDTNSANIGKPMPNTQAYILDNDLQPVPIGVVGEICIGGAGLTRGYLHLADLSAEKFVPNPYSKAPGGRMYRTGDLGRYRANGDIEFIGRRDQQVKVRGFRIELGEIETAIGKFEDVAEVVVTARDDSGGDKRLVAYLVAKRDDNGHANGEINIANLRNYLKGLLPEYMVPSNFITLEKLPLMANGKLDRKALTVPEFAPDHERGELSVTYVAPRNQTEEEMVKIWAEVLDLNLVGVNDDFFDLGGHSLVATQIISRVNKVFEVELAFREFFGDVTVSALCRKIEELKSKRDSFKTVQIVPVSRDKQLPLSFAQERLWFLDQFEPNSVSYNIPMAVRLSGPLNLSALERSFDEIIRRHEALRTRFALIEGEPVQVIEPPFHLELPIIELQSLPVSEREARAKELGMELAHQPFNLHQCPLLRALLLKLEDEEQILFLVMHHIISDGWSMGVFIGEVSALYSAYAEGKASPLTELAIQYGDFACWQRGWLQGEVLERQVAYWKQQLSGITTLQLPTDRPRPPVKTSNGAHEVLSYSKSLLDKLNELSNNQGTTLSMTLLAAFQVLLYRYSGDEQIAVGAPIANRNRAEIEPLIGFFVNTLVMKADLSGNPTFEHLLKQVRELSLDAYAHQDLPFEKLVEEIQPERDTSRSPLFQVMFVLQNFSTQRPELAGLKLSNLDIASNTAKFDIVLAMLEADNGLWATMEFNTDLFEVATIRRMLSHFQVLLESIVANPKKPIAHLSILTEAEKLQLAQFNSTGRDYLADKPVYQLFEAQVARTPSAIAIICQEQQLTYLELNQRANRLARYLRAKGVTADRLVGICLERSVDMIVAILAILKAGGAYVPLEPTYPAQRLAFMLADMEAELLLTESQLLEILPATKAEINLIDRLSPILAEQISENLEPLAMADNLAYMIYTSGTTGEPKAVMVEHGNLTNFVAASQERFHFQRGEAMLCLASFAFDIFLFELLNPLLTGGSCLILTRDEILDNEGLVKRLPQVATVHAVPSLMQQIVNHIKEDSSLGQTINKVFVGGDQVPSALLVEMAAAFPNAAINVLYGPTEATIICANYHFQGRLQTDGNIIGKPLGNMVIRLYDKDENLVPVGVNGEIYIGGKGVTRGYLNRDKLTAEKFVEIAGERFYRTGDLGKYLPDGNIEFLGRIDNQVKIRGFRIELGEIETRLREFDGVKEVVVIARTEGGDKRLVAYLVTDEADSELSGKLRAYLKERLPEYMIPAAFVWLEQLPLTANGKIDRRALPAPEKGQRSENFVGARSPIEAAISEIWMELLQGDRVSIHDNFFELGGHSLLATQVVSRICKSFEIELPLRELFESPTVAGLAERVERNIQAGVKLALSPMLPVSRDKQLPLSFAQERLWFLDQFEPNSPSYNIPMAVRLSGPLNLSALERSFDEIVRRHEALRTRFALVEGEPIQVIDPPFHLEVPIIELQSLPVSEREARAKELGMELAHQPFNLHKCPLLRALLLKLEDEDQILFLVMHHIISDGWSMGVFIGEVSTLYSAYAEGKASPLAELAIQYGDFACWQRGWLQGEVLERQVAYWKQQLSGITTLQLPTDRPRPPVKTSNGAQEVFIFNKQLLDKLNELSNNQGTTLSMTLLAAFQTLLYRYSGDEQIAVGSPIANRNRAEIEPLIGFFVNTLVMKTDLSGNPTFTELLQRVREVALGAYSHQDLPFEKLVEKIQPERDTSHSALFQVMFVFQNAPMAAPALPGIRLRQVELSSTVSKFDLTLSLSEMADGLSGSVDYNRDLFDNTTINRMTEHFRVLLEAICDNSATRLLDMPLLSAVERNLILYQWNKTEEDLPRELLVTDLFEAQVVKTPDNIAIAFEDQQLTYQALNGKANQLARHLQTLGVGPESLVGILVEPSLEMIISLLAVLKAGGGYVPFDTGFPKERLSGLLADAQVVALLSQQRLAEKVPAFNSKLIYLDQDWPEIAQQSSDNFKNSATGTNVAYSIYTSGTTGKSKGILVEHRQLINYLFTIIERLSLKLVKNLAMVQPLTFDSCNTVIYPALTQGATLHLFSREMVSDAEKLGNYFQVHQIDCLKITPSHFAALQGAFGAKQLMPKDRLVIGGEGSRWDFVEMLQPLAANCWIYNHYGPTETTVGVLTNRIDLSKGRQNGSPNLPLGRPIANTEAYILDGNLQPTPIGVAGELFIGGESVARGYLNRPELTAEKFIAHPFTDQPGKRLYRTGDLARYLADGKIEFLGRIDHQVKIRGFRIELGEIEVLLKEHASIKDVVVIAYEDGSEKRLVAYLVLVADETFSAAEMRNYLKQRLPEYMIPAAFVVMDSLPLMSNGKLNRRALPAPLRHELETDRITTLPRNPIEEAVAAIWADILKVGTIDIHSNFFELGGHSLLATQIVSRLRETFQLELALRTIFEAPTVAQLALKIEQALKSAQGLEAPPIVSVTRTEELALSFAQQRLWFLDQLEPGSPFYNMPKAVILKGKLDIDAFEASINEIVRRHESLRTHFLTINGQPIQVITPHLKLQVPIIELDNFNGAEPQDEALRLVKAEALTPFDLSQGPLLRVKLIRLAQEEHLAVLNMHHIVSDGWSMGILISELVSLYDAFSNQLPSPLPELPIQYADFAHWQRSWLSGDVLERQISFWRKQLANLTTLELPLDYPRPLIQTFNGATETLLIPKSIMDRVHQLSNRNGVTLFMTLLAAFDLLLSRYSGAQDISVGTPIANRNRGEIEGLIGFFVNTLVLRTDLADNPTFEQLLKRVRDVALGAYMYQDVPFEKLVEELQPARDMSVTPFFQVFFALQNIPREQMELTNLTLGQVEFKHNTAKFDLSIYLGENDQGLFAAMEYNTDLFHPDTIKRMLGHYEVLLSSIVEHPSCPINELSLLSSSEAEQLLKVWNSTAYPLPAQETIYQLFESQVEQNAHKIAVEFGEAKLTYMELNHRANQLAHHLRALGVEKESLVALCLERSEWMMVALLGIMKAGGAYIPLDPAYPPERLAFMLEDAQPKVLLSQQSLLPLLSAENAIVVAIDRDWPAIAAYSDKNLTVEINGDNLAYVIYTSGSTGKPKGVQLEHRSVVNFLQSMSKEPGLKATDRLLAVTTLSFDIAALELYLPLTVGASLIIASREEAVDGQRLIELLDGITVMQATPATWRMMIEAGWKGKADLKVLCGGEALPKQLAEQLLSRSEELWNLYGPTETTIWSTLQKVAPEQAISIGKPIDNTEIYILDNSLELVAVGIVGELYIGGTGLARGYLKREALTAEKFIDNPFKAGARIYRTGDLARYKADGSIEYLGRIDHQVKLRGYRIELGEIEAAINELAMVSNSVLLAREDTPGDKRLVAYIVADNQQLEDQEVRNELQNERITQWQKVWSETYAHSRQVADSTFNISGWHSSYTGEPIPATEMREWVDVTVARILSLKPAHLLEIGSGMGLLLFRIAGHCKEYVGTDISAAALSYIESNLSNLGESAERVKLIQQTANDLGHFPSAHFDTIVINSVVQYFPHIDYLLEVLNGAVRLLRPGGQIFIGDVRNFALLETFHASVALSRAEVGSNVAQLRTRIQERVAAEEELTIDPAFFYGLPSRIAGIGRVEVRLKAGLSDNELTRFRYDVILHAGEHAKGVELAWRDWQAEQLDLAELRSLLARNKLEILGLRNLPNSLLQEHIKASELINEVGDKLTVGELKSYLPAKNGQVDPGQLIEYFSDLPYRVEMSWTAASGKGAFDLVLKRKDSQVEEAIVQWQVAEDALNKPLHQYANNPLQGTASRRLVPQIRAHLKERLPEYMLPAAFVIMESLPLTPNGKVDRRALPAPDVKHLRSVQVYVAPRDLFEVQLVKIWEELLDIRPIGVKENFFELGGHSLLAVRMMAQISKRLGQQLPLTTLFQRATVEGLAGLLRSRNNPERWSPVVKIKAEGSKTPFFCVHPVGGNVLCYLDLAQRLPVDQPFYGIQSYGLLPGQQLFLTVEEMATRYIEAIKEIQSQGPYIVGGYSVGAIIAFEMAQQLMANGDEVSLLAIIDKSLAKAELTNVDDANDNVSQDARILANLVDVMLNEDAKVLEAALKVLKPDEQISYIFELAERKSLLPPGFEPDQFRKLLELTKTNFSATDRYTVRNYRGKVSVFRSIENATEDPALGWRAVADSIDTYQIVGEHNRLIYPPHVDILVEKLGEALEKVNTKNFDQ